MPIRAPSARRPSADGDFFDRLAAFLVRHRWSVLVAVLALTALGGWRAVKLELRTDLSELLPTKDPAVVVLHEMDRKMAALSSVVMVIQSPSPQANRRFVDDVVPRIRALELPVIDAVEWGVKAEEAFFRHNKLLYPTADELQRGHERLNREILKRKNPLYVDLEDDEPDDGPGKSGQDEVSGPKQSQQDEGGGPKHNLRASHSVANNHVVANKNPASNSVANNHVVANKNPASHSAASNSGASNGAARNNVANNNNKRTSPIDSAAMESREKDLLGRFPDGYYARSDRQLYAVVVWLKSSVFGDRAGEEAASHMREVARALQPTRYHPQMTVGLTGNVITSHEERSALENDLVWATGLSLVLVCLAIFLFYGRLVAIPFFAFPAVCGVILALGFAQLAFGYLNASTAFMGSIIVGNGINYAIIQMARYEEERRAGRAVQQSIAVALRSTWRATVVASIGAAVAYGSLIITSFRGFSQFGYIGGVGMLLSWLLTLTALPAVWAIFDRRTPEQTVPRIKGFAFAEPLGAFVVRHPGLCLALGAALTIAAVLPIPRYARDPFEYNFENLRNQRARLAEGEVLSGKLDPLFGRTLSPSFIVTNSVDEADEVRRVLRDTDKRYKILGDVRTVGDLLPGTAEEQRRKLAVLAKIRTLIDKNIGTLDDKDRRDLERWRPPNDLRVLRPDDLPLNLKRYFREKDGTVGRIVIYFPREDITVWDGRTQLRLAAVVQEVRLPGGGTVRSSGSSVIFAAMINAITRDGPIVTAAAFLGVALLVVLLVRQRLGTALVLGVLCIGVLWMVGAAAGWYVRLNFLNFIALPITFGIGVDYGVNLQLRYRQEGRGRVSETVAATGGAVALCSATTIIGYAALLVADNYALRSFGMLAILGEFACLIAALLVLPAVLVVLERRAAHAVATT